MFLWYLFLEEISSLLFSSISLHWSLRKVFSSLLAILWNIAFRWIYLSLSPLLFTSPISAICEPPQTTILPFHISFSWGWSWSLLPVQCQQLLSTVFQVLCLPDLIHWISLSLPLCDCKRYDLGHTWMVYWFSLLQLKSEFGNKEFMIWVTVSSQSCFCWLYRASSSLAAKNIISLILILTIWWCPCVESSLVLLEEIVCYD